MNALLVRRGSRATAWRSSELQPEARQYGGVLRGSRSPGMDHSRRRQHGLAVERGMVHMVGHEILYVIGSQKGVGIEVKVESR